MTTKLASDTGYVAIEDILALPDVLLTRADFNDLEIVVDYDGREAIRRVDAREKVADGRQRYATDRRIRDEWARYPDDRTARRSAAYQAAAGAVDITGLHGSVIIQLQQAAGQRAIQAFDAREPFPGSGEPGAPRDMYDWWARKTR